jgi:hypothetical protein
LTSITGPLKSGGRIADGLNVQLLFGTVFVLAVTIGIGEGLGKVLGGTFLAAPWWVWALLVGTAECSFAVSMGVFDLARLITPTENSLPEREVHEERQQAELASRIGKLITDLDLDDRLGHIDESLSSLSTRIDDIGSSAKDRDSELKLSVEALECEVQSVQGDLDLIGKATGVHHPDDDMG